MLYRLVFKGLSWDLHPFYSWQQRTNGLRLHLFGPCSCSCSSCSVLVLVLVLFLFLFLFFFWPPRCRGAEFAQFAEFAGGLRAKVLRDDGFAHANTLKEVTFAHHLEGRCVRSTFILLHHLHFLLARRLIFVTLDPQPRIVCRRERSQVTFEGGHDFSLVPRSFARGFQ